MKHIEVYVKDHQGPIKFKADPDNIVMAGRTTIGATGSTGVYRFVDDQTKLVAEVPISVVLAVVVRDNPAPAV